jgi:hypothetical protein
MSRKTPEIAQNHSTAWRKRVIDLWKSGPFEAYCASFQKRKNFCQKNPNLWRGLILEVFSSLEDKSFLAQRSQRALFPPMRKESIKRIFPLRLI